MHAHFCPSHFAKVPTEYREEHFCRTPVMHFYCCPVQAPVSGHVRCTKRDTEGVGWLVNRNSAKVLAEMLAEM